MDLTYGAEYEKFRNEVRSFIESHRSQAPDGGGMRAEKNRAWQKMLIERGYTARTIPREYGGHGGEMDILKSRIIAEEFAQAQVPGGLGGQGISMLVPTLLEMGTEEQKRQFIPPTLRGEMIWCQGYSEPNAGSDLASLRTNAVLDGDDWVVNGQKIWTSTAQYADWIFCLVRTEPNAPKHQGISFLLFDMESPGVSTSPITLISGSSPFCQTFFDNVKVPKQNLVGTVNHGWTIAKRLLQHERQMVAGIGGNSALGATGRKMEDIAKEYVGDDDGRIADAAIRSKITSHRMNDRAFQLTLGRSVEEAKAGRANGDLSSMFKYYGTEQNKRKYEVLLETMGTQAVGWDGDAFSDRELNTTRQWLRSKANSIEGGTSEVQLNVIAKRVLGLPD